MHLFSRPTLFLFILIILSAFTAEAQLYQIRLMATNKDVPQGYFDALKDIGVIYQETENGITKVYLGNYWGRPTADHFLALVVARGFQSAYLTNKELNSEETHTLQFLALSDLNIKILPKEIHPHLIIIEKDGIYKLSLGLTATTGPKFQELKELLAEIGRENFWIRRLWRPTTIEILKDTEIIKSQQPKNPELLPTIKKSPEAKLRASKLPDDSK